MVYCGSIFNFKYMPEDNTNIDATPLVAAEPIKIDPVKQDKPTKIVRVWKYWLIIIFLVILLGISLGVIVFLLVDRNTSGSVTLSTSSSLTSNSTSLSSSASSTVSSSKTSSTSTIEDIEFTSEDYEISFVYPSTLGEVTIEKQFDDSELVTFSETSLEVSYPFWTGGTPVEPISTNVVESASGQDFEIRVYEHGSDGDEFGVWAQATGDADGHYVTFLISGIRNQKSAENMADNIAEIISILEFDF